MRKVLACAAAAIVVSAGALLPATPAAAAAASGSFNVLTYNVAGLPESLSSASTPRAESTTT
ncbi:MAG: hypothetical protein ACM3ZF_09505, partial [Mycobacterium leprae]